MRKASLLTDEEDGQERNNVILARTDTVAFVSAGIVANRVVDENPSRDPLLNALTSLPDLPILPINLPIGWDTPLLGLSGRGS